MHNDEENGGPRNHQRDTERVLKSLFTKSAQELDQQLTLAHYELREMNLLNEKRNDVSFEAIVRQIEDRMANETNEPENHLSQGLKLVLMKLEPGEGWSAMVSVAYTIHVFQAVSWRYFIKGKPFNQGLFLQKGHEITCEYVYEHLEAVIKELGGWEDFIDFARHRKMSQAMKMYRKQKRNSISRVFICLSTVFLVFTYIRATSK